MSSFAGIAFKVMGEGGTFPTVEYDADGTRRYRATIRIASRADTTALAAKATRVTVLPVYGRFGANVHILGGPGTATLSVPQRAGALATYSAILTLLSEVQADGSDATRFTAAAEFVVVS